MKPPDHRLAELLSRARRASPPSGVPVAPDDVRLFAQRTASAWKRRKSAGALTTDPWRLWERTGNWSLAAATALVIVAFLQPERSLQPNPFDAFGPVEVEDFNLF